MDSVHLLTPFQMFAGLRTVTGRAFELVVSDRLCWSPIDLRRLQDAGLLDSVRKLPNDPRSYCPTSIEGP